MRIETLQQARALVRRLQSLWRACHGPAVTKRFPIVGTAIRGAFRAQRLVRPVHYRQWAFERRYPEAPWLTPASIQRLERVIRSDMIGCEFGSGRSTLWLGRRLAHLYSIEGDPDWYLRTKKSLGALPVLLLYAEGTDYAHAIDGLPNRWLDLVVIDGHDRLASLAHAMPKLKDEGILVIDNFDDPIYQAIRNDTKRLPGTELYANGIWETAIFFLSRRDQRQYWQDTR